MTEEDGNEEVTQVLDVDPTQLAQLLAQSADGTAQLIDEHGNAITLTAEQLAEAGINLETLDGAQVLQLQEGQYIQGDDGQIYIIEGDNVREMEAEMVSNERKIQQPPPPGIKVTPAAAAVRQPPPSRGRMQTAPMADGSKEWDPSKRMVDEYRRMVQEREMRLAEMEQKLKETTEQNVIMAHALVSTCKSQEVEVVVQSPDGRAGKRQIVSVRKSGAGEAAPDGSYMVTGEGGETHIVTPGARGRSLAQGSTPTMRRPNDAFQAGLLPYQCDQCPRRFAQDHHLKRHQEMAHAKKRPFFCQFCNRDLYLSSDIHFQGHMRMQHKQEMEMEANFQQAGKNAMAAAGVRPTGSGQRAFGTQQQGDEPEEEEPDWDSLEAEKREIAERDGDENNSKELQPQAGGEFKCTLCNKEYVSMAGLKKHARDEHNVIIEEPKIADKKNYRCVICEKMFSKQEFLDKHKMSHTDQQPFPCQYCPRRFKWKENLIKHLNWHMERMPFKCAYCSKGFPSQTRLEVHHKAKHLPKQRDHVCPICQKGFYEKEYLAKHMRVHGSRIHPCPECDKKFIDEKFLRRHMTTHTQLRDFTCDVCGKAFNRAANLKAHRHLHTNERPYKCRSCGRTFSQRHNLKAHEKLHEEIKTYVCDVCGRNFRQKCNLDVHSRCHKDIRPFQCSSCRKTFSRMEHLQTHINAHKGIRPYPCSQCDKAFYSCANLKQHERLHKGEKPFQCGTCGKAFSQRHHLAKHLKSHTKNTDIQYVVIWEKGGTLQEATIITDGVAQDAAGMDEQTATTEERGAGGEVTIQQAGSRAVPNGGEPSDVSGRQTAAEGVEAAAPRANIQGAAAGATFVTEDGTPLDPSQLQLVDEHGNPITGLSEQLLILGDGTSREGGTVLDQNALLALAEAQGEDGTIYISEENLQALAQQGVVFSYQE